jgi:hypothetical protein
MVEGVIVWRYPDLHQSSTPFPSAITESSWSPLFMERVRSSHRVSASNEDSVVIAKQATPKTRHGSKVDYNRTE